MCGVAQAIFVSALCATSGATPSSKSLEPGIPVIVTGCPTAEEAPQTDRTVTAVAGLYAVPLTVPSAVLTVQVAGTPVVVPEVTAAALPEPSFTTIRGFRHHSGTHTSCRR